MGFPTDYRTGLAGRELVLSVAGLLYRTVESATPNTIGI